jgi:hypothetical protein
VWPGKYAHGAGAALWRAFSQEFLHPLAAAQLLGILLAGMLPTLLRRVGVGLPPRLVAAWYAAVGLVLAWQWTWARPILDIRAGGWTCLLPAMLILQALASIWEGFVRRGQPASPDYHLVAATAAFSLCSLAQYYPVSDSWHTTWALAPTFGLVVFSWWRWSGWPASLTAVAVTLAFLPSVYFRLQAAREALAEPYVTLTQPAVLRGMKVRTIQGRLLNEISTQVDRVLKVRPDIPSALIGNDALYLCFTPNRTNPSPYFVTWDGLIEGDDNKRRWAQILKNRSLIFFLKTDWAWTNNFYRQTGYVPLIYFQDYALEIAVPPEVADDLGVTAYGAPKVKPAP